MVIADLPPGIVVPAVFAFVAGLFLLARGLTAVRNDARVQAIAPSRVGSMAAGEVRLTGVVEPLVQTLVSPLQSRACVWYRAHAQETGDDGRTLVREERAVEFALRDATGTVRIVPRGARWMIDDAFDETTGFLGDEPDGLQLRSGPTTAAIGPLELQDREAQVAALLTVRPSGGSWDVDEDTGGTDLLDLVGLGGAGGSGPVGVLERRTRYREARIEPGDTVTLIGYAQPWSDTLAATPGAAFTADAPMDAALAFDLDAARAAGTLAPDAATAWGNAAIPGFGIGRPAGAPTLDPDARPLPAADPALVERAERLFEIPDHQLVISSGPGVPLTVYAGAAVEAEAHHDRGFLMGIGGAALSAASAFVIMAIATGRP